MFVAFLLIVELLAMWLVGTISDPPKPDGAARIASGPTLVSVCGGWPTGFV